MINHFTDIVDLVVGGNNQNGDGVFGGFHEISIAKKGRGLIKYVMEIEVVTLFPKMFEAFLAEGVLGRAIKKGLVKVKTHDMRKWAWNNYGAVDDRP